MLSVLIAAVAIAAPPDGQVAVIAAAPSPVEARRDADDSATRRVCRFERATGSNRQQRVCRDVARQGVQDQQTREFLRSQQRIRLPDELDRPPPGRVS